MTSCRCATAIRLILCVAMIFWGAACSSKRFNYDYSKEPNLASNAYLVGPSDVLRIHVWRDPDLSGEVQVRPDGMATIALIGEVKVTDLTTSQIEDEIARRLSRYMDGDRVVVTVAVLQANSYFFTVSGNVNKPGRYNTGSYVTVVEALALAGEPNVFADIGSIMILRGGPGESKRQIPINYKTLLKAEDLKQNVMVMRGDVIIVP